MGLNKTETMKLIDIQYTAKEQMRASRNMDLALAKPRMERLIKSSTEEEYKALEQIVKDMNIDRLRSWEHNHSTKELEDLLIADLRDKARKLHIKNYARLDAIELLDKVRHELNNRRDARNSRRNDAHSQQSGGGKKT